MFNRSLTRKSSESVGRLVASRYNVRSKDEKGDLILYNSYTGQISVFSQGCAGTVIEILRRGVDISQAGDGVINLLFEMGFLIDENVDEFSRGNLQKKLDTLQDRILNLIIMPNEDCNFRCVYCYESFVKNKMPGEIQDRIVALVAREIDRYDGLSISWFGGEPLTVMDVVTSLSLRLMTICKRQNKSYVSNMTTNGYLLTRANLETLLKLRVTSFQITLDGDRDTHDTHRVTQHGMPTFEAIYKNLLDAKNTRYRFSIVLRSNVDHENLKSMRQLMDKYVEEFSSDERFTFHFVPVLQLSSESDVNLRLCSTRDVFPLIEEASSVGLNFGLYEPMTKPHGSVCYAAKPTSFVIGSDGMLYKCTVAFDNPLNHVGNLLEDGLMELYYDRYALWISNGATEDPSCQRCFFRPSCQGEACPLQRIETGEAPCPPIKTEIKSYLRLITKQRNETPIHFD